MNKWINHDVSINFTVPDGVQELIKMCERADTEKDYAYFNYEEALDYACKELVTIGEMTQKQWDMIRERYESYD